MIDALICGLIGFAVGCLCGWNAGLDYADKEIRKIVKKFDEGTK